MRMGDGKFCWYWGRGQEPEHCHGPEDTREAILQVAELETEGRGDFTIIEADKATPSTEMFSCGDVLEQYEEFNAECWGEDGADFHHVTPDAERELESALSAALYAWMEKHDCHGYAYLFGRQRNVEYFPAKAGAP